MGRGTRRARDSRRGLHLIRAGFAGKPHEDVTAFRERAAAALGDRHVHAIAADSETNFVYVVTGDEFVYRFTPDGVPEQRLAE